MNVKTAIEGFKIIAKYSETQLVYGEHDMIGTAGPDLNEISKEDRTTLEDLGWFWNEEWDGGWCHFC